MSNITDLDVPLERDVFLRTLLHHLAGTLQKVVGLDEASGFVSVVGQQIGDEINRHYRNALGVSSLTRQQVADVLVDLKRRIQGDFFVIEQDDEKIVLGNRACPFAEQVVGRPALCMMTSNVFGSIAADNLGYAKVDIEQAIANGDPGCRVVVYLQATPTAAAARGRSTSRARSPPLLPVTPEQFLLLADALPEPMLLLSDGGRVLAGNRALQDRLGICVRTTTGRLLTELVSDPEEEVRDYLRMCSRSRSMVLGAVALRREESNGIACRTEGSLVRKRNGDTEALLILRLLPKASAAEQFLDLNRRIEDLGREIQRRRQAEAAAHQEAERLRVLLRSLGEAVLVTDAEGRVSLLNPVAEALTGWKGEEAAGQPLELVFDIVNEHTRARVENPATRALREGIVVGLANHTILIAKDGSERPIDDSAAPIRDEHGRTVGAVLVFRDVTERRRAEEALRESEETFRSMADTIPQLAWMARPDGHIFWFNQRWYSFTGTGPGQTDGWDWQSLHDPEVLPKVLERWRSSLASGEPFEMVFPLRGADGTYRSFLTRVSPLRNAAGQIIRWFGTNTDITDATRTEEALRKSEQGFRQLADAMPQIVWAAGRDGEIEYLNRRWAEFTGLPQTVGNSGWKGLLHPEDAATANRRWAESRETGAPFEMQIRLLGRREQGHRWHLIRTVAVRDAEGAVARWFGTATDIHDQKRSEESSRFLAQASAELAAVVDYASTLQKITALAVPFFADWSAVDLADQDGTLRRLAVAHQDRAKVELVSLIMQEYPPDPAVPTGAYGVLRSGRPEFVPEITDDMLSAGARDERHLGLIRSLGLKSYLCVPLVVSGNTLGVLTFATAESGRRYTDADLGIAVDLAQRAAVAIENNQLYQALRETDRRKDEFLATLAHELRNPLAPVRNALQILEAPGVDAQTAARSREIMKRQVQHLVRLVDDLLDVSRVMQGKIELRRERVELAEVVARAVETVQPLIEAQGQDLTVCAANEALWVDADPVRLAQVVGNLLTNAAKYTERGGGIRLTTERDDDMAVLRVQDEGVGIPPHMLSRIFDLFVQVEHAPTRSQGGLGIGLTLVKNLVERHNGIVEAHSDGPGHGSEFVVRLPLVATALRPVSAAPVVQEADRSPTRRGKSILVVDDNRDAADSLAILLRLQGHEVRVAYSGLAALEMSRSWSPDAVFLDIGMPGMDGYETARRLRRMPGLAGAVLVALTGWGQQEDRRRTAEAGFDHHVVKPPDPAAVAGILSRPLPGQ